MLELAFKLKAIFMRKLKSWKQGRRLSGFFNGKIWICWDVGLALFRKVTLFSLRELFCGPQVCQKYGPHCWGSSSVEGDD